MVCSKCFWKLSSRVTFGFLTKWMAAATEPWMVMVMESSRVGEDVVVLGGGSTFMKRCQSVRHAVTLLLIRGSKGGMR